MFTAEDLNTVFMTHADMCRKMGGINPVTAHNIMRKHGIKSVLIAGRQHWYSSDVENVISREEFQEQASKLVSYRA
jgi:hypothetical protein